MLLSGQNPIISVMRVYKLSWKSGVFEVAPRAYAALAIRLRGTGVLCADGKSYSVGERDIVYLPQGLAYTAEYSDTEMIAIHFVTAKADRSIEVYSPGNWNALLPLFQKAFSMWESRQPQSIPYTLSALYKIFAILCEDRAKNIYPDSLSTAAAFIHKNYANSILRIKDICNAAGISETALRQLFWKYLQKTPVEYINGLRIEQAQDYIAQGLSVSDAAKKCGFGDSKYFARVVKKHLGCTPKSLKLYGK